VCQRVITLSAASELHNTAALKQNTQTAGCFFYITLLLPGAKTMKRRPPLSDAQDAAANISSPGCAHRRRRALKAAVMNGAH
jgi:hypothetical protein